MQLIHALADPGFDWAKLLGGITAGITILSYGVGVVRPIALQQSRYRHDGVGTYVTVVVKNRSLLFDRNVQRIFLYRVPGLFKRAFQRNHGKSNHPAKFVPWGDALPTVDNALKLSKRESKEIEFELRNSVGIPQHIDLEKTIRIGAKSGARRSRSKRIRLLDTEND